MGPAGPGQEGQRAQDTKRLQWGLTHNSCLTHASSFLTWVLVGLRWSHILCSRDPMPGEQALGGAGTPGHCEDCRCPRGCEGSGDLPFLLACSLPPFSQSSPSFPPGNRWGGQVTRANAFPEEPWRDRSTDSGEFFAGQDARAVHFPARRKVLFIQTSPVVHSGSRAQSLALLKPPPTAGIAA